MSAGWGFAELWEVIAAARPEWPALVHGGVVRTWSVFDRRSASLASGLREIARPGTGVAVHVRNSPEFAECLFACMKASLVPVPSNYRYKGPELAEVWTTCDVSVVVYGREFRSRVDEARRDLPGVALWVEISDHEEPVPTWATPYEVLVERNARLDLERVGGRGDGLVIKCTGGTTGRPKGVIWRQRDLFELLNRHNAFLRYDTAAGLGAVAARLTERGPVLLPASPLVHGTAMMRCLSVLSVGGSVVTCSEPGFSADATLRLIGKHRVEILTIVGDAFGLPLVHAMAREPSRWDMSSLRTVTSSGARWSASCKVSLLRLLPQVTLVETLGATETTGMGVAVASHPEEVLPTGVFRLGAEARVLDDDGNEVPEGSERVGRLVVGGPQPCGFYNDPARTADTFRAVDGRRVSCSGDLAVPLPGGLIRHVGRREDCIVTGGEKVFPGEVDNALIAQSQVTDAATLGMPDAQRGQRVAAVVVLAGPGDPGNQVGVVLEALRSRLASYKVPDPLVPVATIPRSLAGKLDTERVTALLSARAEGVPG